MPFDETCPAGRGRWLSALATAALVVACGSGVTATTPTPPGPPIAEIDIFGPDATLPLGSTFQFIVVALDSSFHKTTTPPITWTSSAPNVATISAAGLVTALALGTTTITATTGKLTRSATVKVGAGPAITLVIGGPAAGLAVGVKYSFVVTARDQSGNLLASPSITWSSSSMTVATISATGVVTTLMVGNTVITAAIGTLTASFSLTVLANPGVAMLQISGLAAPLPVGTSTSVNATTRNAQGLYLGDPAATWSSSDPQVVTITTPGPASSVRLTAVGVGTATIQAQFGGLTAQLPVTVTALQASDARVALFPDGELGDTIQLAPGQALQLTGYAYSTTSYAYYILASAGATAWTSSRPDLAAVSSGGVVTAIANGTAQITATMSLGSVASPIAVSASRTIRVASTAGTATIRLLNASDAASSLTLQPNAGAPISLAPGQVSTLSIPAGTFQLRTAEHPPSATYDCGSSSQCFDGNRFGLAQFTGLLPGGSQATFVATATPYGFSLMPLWDFGGPVAADSVRIRVGLVTTNGYNVYIVPTGVALGLPFLEGCYLDWPFGFTGYASRLAGTFDIVLQPGKGITGVESARFTVMPTPGRATTYILTGNTAATLKLIALVDN